jgi:hypothetical protein
VFTTLLIWGASRQIPRQFPLWSRDLSADLSQAPTTARELICVRIIATRDSYVIAVTFAAWAHPIPARKGRIDRALAAHGDGHDPRRSWCSRALLCFFGRKRAPEKLPPQEDTFMGHIQLELFRRPQQVSMEQILGLALCMFAHNSQVNHDLQHVCTQHQSNKIS